MKTNFALLSLSLAAIACLSPGCKTTASGSQTKGVLASNGATLSDCMVDRPASTDAGPLQFALSQPTWGRVSKDMAQNTCVQLLFYSSGFQLFPYSSPSFVEFSYPQNCPLNDQKFNVNTSDNTYARMLKPESAVLRLAADNHGRLLCGNVEVGSWVANPQHNVDSLCNYAFQGVCQLVLDGSGKLSGIHMFSPSEVPPIVRTGTYSGGFIVTSATPTSFTTPIGTFTCTQNQCWLGGNYEVNPYIVVDQSTIRATPPVYTTVSASDEDIVHTWQSDAIK